MGIKRCPKCGSERLLARRISGVHVESLENGEYQIKAEGKNYQIEIIGCARCKSDFDESQLVEMTKCNKCGKFVTPEELDSNGNCEVCRALEERPDLVNMSKEDIIRMMLKLERSTSNNIVTTLQEQKQLDYNKQETRTESVVSSVAEEKMKAAQAAIENASNDFSKEIIQETATEQSKVNEIKQEIMNPPEESETTSDETEKPRRGRKPRKKDDSTTVTEEVTQEQIEQATNEMSNYQEAPFPEQDSQIKEMFDNTQMTTLENTEVNYSNTPVNNNVTVQSPFQMFEEEQAF